MAIDSKITLLAATVLIATISTIARAEISFATAGPLTGQIAGFGEQQRQGAERAVADLNAKGGALGEPIEPSSGAPCWALRALRFWTASAVSLPSRSTTSSAAIRAIA